MPRPTFADDIVALLISLLLLGVLPAGCAAFYNHSWLSGLGFVVAAAALVFAIRDIWRRGVPQGHPDHRSEIRTPSSKRRREGRP